MSFENNYPCKSGFSNFRLRHLDSTRVLFPILLPRFSLPVLVDRLSTPLGCPSLGSLPPVLSGAPVGPSSQVWSLSPRVDVVGAEDKGRSPCVNWSVAGVERRVLVIVDCRVPPTQIGCRKEKEKEVRRPQ